MKTTLHQNIQNDQRPWFIIDAENEGNLGKLGIKIANALSGKTNVNFTPHTDGGAYVVVLNANKVKVSGNKELDKKYYNHSGYLGHLKTQSLSEVRAKKPRRILEDAVSGMLPKNRHRKNRMRRLFLVLEGEKNPYEAQKPTPLV